MTIYGIATTMGDSGGHGEPSINHTVIKRLGPYGSGNFEPFFMEREAAENHIAGMESNFGLRVQEFQLIETP